jgi:hypothetical protein
MFRQMLFYAGMEVVTALRPGWNPYGFSMALESFAFSKIGSRKILIIWPD